MNNLIEPQTLRPFTKFCCTIGALPSSYLLSLTYEEQLLWFCKFLKDTVIPAINNNADALEELQKLYIELKNYVDNYFDNLDVQDEINNKLDEMVEDGTLDEILNEFFTKTTGLTFSTFQELKNFDDLISGNKCKTLGFYEINDGGCAEYFITNEKNDNIPQLDLTNGLYANLISDIINVKSMGAYGNNENDDTAIIQKCINYNKNVYFPCGTYKLTKNEELNFSANDEPCLAVQSQNDIKLFGNNAILSCKVHAQTILEIINSSNITIENLKFEGLGIFPELDGTSGRGEKGNSEFGYETSGFWGSHKNNNYDTSNFTSHASINNGQPWGVFNGGFIGNIGMGVLIHNNSNYVTIKNCELYGFNYSGIAVGFLGEVDNLVSDSKNIYILNNKIHDCYNSAIDCVMSNNLTIENNTIYKIGHPNAVYTNVFCDPGYGIKLTGTSYSQSKNNIISSNNIEDCIRKGIDLHGGENSNITNNIIKNCFICGIFAYSASPNLLVKKVLISNNTILECAYASNTIGAIRIGGYNNSENEEDIEKTAIITSNIIENCSGTDEGIISSHVFDTIICSNNIIKGLSEKNQNSAIYAIHLGTTTDQNSKLGIITNNIISINNENVTGGIYANKLDNGIITNNLIDIAVANLINTNQSNVANFNNYSSLEGLMGLSQQGINIPYVNALTTLKQTQFAQFNNSLYYKDANSIAAKVPRIIAFYINANNTENPNVTYVAGQEYVRSVVSIDQGVRINLQNITDNPSAQIFDGGSTILNVSNTPINYRYFRAMSSSAIDIGLKTSGTENTHTPIANCTSGGLLINILF